MTNTSANPARSGEVLTFRVSLSCAAVAAAACTNGKITIPFDPQSARYFLGVAPSHPLVKSAVATNDGIVVTLDPNFPAGSTIEFDLKGFGSQNGTTPNGYKITWVAVVDGDNTDPAASEPITETYTAEAELQVKKYLPSDAPDGTPMPLDETFRYRIRTCDPRSIDDNEPGRLYIKDGTLVDTLLDGVQFVAASPGGTYDPAANTVTWPAANQPTTACSSSSNGAQYWVDVKYPSPRFKAGDQVSNKVDVSGLPYGETQRISATYTLPHTLGAPTASGIICKRALGPLAPTPACNSTIPARTWPGPWQASGNEAQWFFNATNKSTIAAQLDIVDPLPCRAITDGLTPAMYLSGASGQPCADPAFTVRSIGPFRWGHTPTVDNVANTPWLREVDSGNYPTYVTPAGDVKPFVRQDTGGTYINNSKLWAFRSTTFVPQGADVVSEVRWTGVHFATNEAGPDWPVNGYTDEDLRAGERLENKAQFTFHAGTALFTAPNIARLQVTRDVVANVTKTIFTAGGGFQISGSVQDGGTDHTWDEGLVLADLLPPGVPDANLTDTGYDRGGRRTLPASAYTFEKIPDYHGTGRTLLRLTVAKGFKFDAGGLIAANFAVPGGFPPGGRTNEARVFLPGVTIDGCLNGSVFTSDSDDWDGDGTISPDTHCRATAAVSVAGSSPLVRVLKEVKGNLDQSFARFPGVGQIDPSRPGGAQYRVTVSNDGNVTAKDVVVYDVFPRPGDTGISATQLGHARESDFATALTGPITAPAGWTVEYSRATNPCRDEVGDGSSPWPASCTNDWSGTPPADLATVTAARFRQNPGTTLAPAGNVVFTWSVSIPSLLPNTGVPVVAPLPAPGDVAWNTTALSATRADNNQKLPPSEPPKVGLAVPQTDISLAKTVSPASAMVGQEVEYTLTVRHDARVVTASDGSVSYVDPAGNPTGNIAPATGVVVSDAFPDGLDYVKGSEVVPRGTFDPNTGTWNVGTLQPGDTAAMTYRAVVRDTGSHVNRAEVTAEGVADADSKPGNCTGTGARMEDDCATATVQTLHAGISLKKMVASGPGSDQYLDAPGNGSERGVFPSGAPVPYRFVVTNTGDVPLKSVSISDPKIPVGCETQFSIGDLAPGASKTVDCTWGAGWGAGVTVNTATVSGQPPAGDPITAADDAQVVVPSPAVTVKKYTNGQDADTADSAVSVSNGAAITWRYVITNSGTDALTDLTLSDDKESAVALAEDKCTRSAGDWGSPLPVGESITCEFPGTATYGYYTNTATVTGKGSVTPLVVTDTDVSGYLAPAPKPSVSVKKYTNDIDGDTAAVRPKLEEGATVTWKYVVVNDGNEPLADLSLVDDKEKQVALTDAACDRSMGPWGSPLPPSESITCTFTGVARAGDYVNTATVSGTSTVTSAKVAGADPSGYHADAQPSPREVLASVERAQGVVATTTTTPNGAAGTSTMPGSGIGGERLGHTGANIRRFTLVGLALILLGFGFTGFEETRLTDVYAWLELFARTQPSMTRALQARIKRRRR